MKDLTTCHFTLKMRVASKLVPNATKIGVCRTKIRVTATKDDLNATKIRVTATKNDLNATKIPLSATNQNKNHHPPLSYINFLNKKGGKPCILQMKIAMKK